ncbi:ATP:cob(I)alamin adenosyltransferase, partial [Pseudomonas syringae pv. actinidiae ICMP 18804]
CQHLNAVEPLEGAGLAYINRLSDLLFVAARLIARRQGIAEILWEPAPKPVRSASYAVLDAPRPLVRLKRSRQARTRVFLPRPVRRFPRPVGTV